MGSEIFELLIALYYPSRLPSGLFRIFPSPLALRRCSRPVFCPKVTGIEPAWSGAGSIPVTLKPHEGAASGTQRGRRARFYILLKIDSGVFAIGRRRRP